MNRRGFLRLCGMAVAVPSLPVASKLKENPYMPQWYKDKLKFARPPKQCQWPEKFDPIKGCSHAVRWTVVRDLKMQDEMRVTAKAVLIKNMESYVPFHYRRYVRYCSKVFNWGETEAMSWYYEPPETEALHPEETA